MSTIDSKAVQAREHARRPDGRFGEQRLGEVAFVDELPPLPTINGFDLVGVDEDYCEVEYVTNLSVTVLDDQGQEYRLTRMVDSNYRGELRVRTVLTSRHEELALAEERFPAVGERTHAAMVADLRAGDWTQFAELAHRELHVPVNVRAGEHSPRQVCGWLNDAREYRHPSMILGATSSGQDGLGPCQAVIGDRLYEHVDTQWQEVGDPYGEPLELPEGVELEEDFPPGAKTHACRWHGDYFWEKATYADGSTFTKRQGPGVFDTEHYTPTSDGWQRTRTRRLDELTSIRHTVVDASGRESELTLTGSDGTTITARAQQSTADPTVTGTAFGGNVSVEGTSSPSREYPATVTTPRGTTQQWALNGVDVDSPELLSRRLAMLVNANSGLAPRRITPNL